jgi:hypothetical protein
MYTATGLFSSEESQQSQKSLDGDALILLFCEEQVDGLLAYNCGSKNYLIECFKTCTSMPNTRLKEFQWACEHIDEILNDMLAHKWIRVYDDDVELRRHIIKWAFENTKIASHLSIEYTDEKLTINEIVHRLPVDGCFLSVLKQEPFVYFEIDVTGILNAPLKIPKNAIYGESSSSTIPVIVRAVCHEQVVQGCTKWTIPIESIAQKNDSS